MTAHVTNDGGDGREPTIDELVDELNPEPTYDDLVWSAVAAALAVLSAKIVSVYVIGRMIGATVSIDWWRGLVPHIQFATTSENFTLIVTLSTLVMAAVALGLAGLTFSGRLASTRQRVLGRGVASVIVLQTLALEAYRHRVQDATIRWSFAWLTIIAGVAGITLLAMSLWKDRAGELDMQKDNRE